MRTHFGAFKSVFTDASGHGAELAAEAARQGTKLIIACGGDGTISKVANGILSSGHDAELGSIPSETGGDLEERGAFPHDPEMQLASCGGKVATD